MKCPKCGYNSFESHDSCKKCSSDLSGYKQTYGIAPIVFPLEIREKMAATLRAASVDEPIAESVESHEDMFAFDLPEETATAAATFKDDPFDFDKPAQAAGLVQGKVEDDPFADLLETTPQVSSDPFGSPAAAAAPQAAAATSAPGEFELENFSWDDTPAATSGSGGQADADDFDSLFGDADESAKK